MCMWIRSCITVIDSTSESLAISIIIPFRTPGVVNVLMHVYSWALLIQDPARSSSHTGPRSRTLWGAVGVKLCINPDVYIIYLDI